MIVLDILVVLLFIVGIFFRLQSSTNIVTMGAIPIALAFSIYGFSNGNVAIGIKSLVIIVFVTITNPVASYAMTRAAYKSGAELCDDTKCDEYGRDLKDE